MSTLDVKHDLTQVKSSLGLTNADLANRMHVSEQTVYNWLKGKNASAKNTKKITKLVGDVKVGPGITYPLALHNVARRLDIGYRRLIHARFTDLIPLDARNEEMWEQLLQAVVAYPAIFSDVDY